MGLRDELEKEMGQAAQRIPLVLEKSVYGVGPSTDDPVQQVKNVVQAQLDLYRIHSAAILRLANAIEDLQASKET